MKGHWLSLLGWMALCFAAAGVGGLAGPDSWYRAIDKPPWNPPDWVFGPVWTVLYVMMGVAAWLVWRERASAAVTIPLGLFLIQLILNSLWSWVFFRWHQPGWALVELVALWMTVLLTVLAFRSVRPLAGALLVPYLLWVTFAGVLNASIWLRNRG